MIPQTFVDKHLQNSVGLTVFGIPVEKLTKNELIACVQHLQEAEQNAIEEGVRQRKFWGYLRGVPGGE